MTVDKSRREFITWTALGVAGAMLAPLPAFGGGRGRYRVARRVDRHPDDGLPPRTVALRSLGGDFVFDPPGLRLAPGEALTWLNMGDFHTTTAFHPDNAELLAGDVPLRIPEGAEPWHSGMLGLTDGTEFTHRFEVPGVYDYFCQPHYSFGMVGRIVVPAPEDAAPSARPAEELNEASRAELPTVDSILGAPGRSFEWIARINGMLLLRAHGEPMASPADRLFEDISGDGVLGRRLAETGVSGQMDAALERLREAVESGADYETLVVRADEAKAPLQRAVGDGR